MDGNKVLWVSQICFRYGLLTQVADSWVVGWNKAGDEIRVNEFKRTEVEIGAPVIGLGGARRVNGTSNNVSIHGARQLKLSQEKGASDLLMNMCHLKY